MTRRDAHGETRAHRTPRLELDRSTDGRCEAEVVRNAVGHGVRHLGHRPHEAQRRVPTPSGVTRRRALAGSCALAVVISLVVWSTVVPSQATARSIWDSDIGWPPGLRVELGLALPPHDHCTTSESVAARRRFKRLSETGTAITAVVKMLQHGPSVFGGEVQDNCDGGRIRIAIASSAGPRYLREKTVRAKKMIKNAGLSDDVRLFAVRSTINALILENRRIGGIVYPLLDGGVNIGPDAARNAIEIHVPKTTTQADLAALHDIARRSPVNVVVYIDPGDEFVVKY